MIVTDWQKYYPYFTESEFVCKHTGKCSMSQQFMDLLLAYRIIYNRAMIITSAYRDITHPVEADKNGTLPGEHTMGLAVDFEVRSGSDRYAAIDTAFRVGFPRIGINPRFIHLGNSQAHPLDVVWLYN